MTVIQSEQRDLIDFSINREPNAWKVINDGVMGGMSRGIFQLGDDVGVFKGKVSTENNGGFTLMRNRPGTIDLDGYNTFVLRLKGDGKKYKFRVKTTKYEQCAYTFEFTTSGAWEDIEIPFSKLEPRFRGKSLDMPNFEGRQIEEVAFLISNKQTESFEIQIARISTCGPGIS